MITVSRNQRTIRQTSAEFQYTDPQTGKIEFGTVRILYYSPRTCDLEALQRRVAEATKNGNAWYWTDRFIYELHALPDILDENGKELFEPVPSDPPDESETEAYAAYQAKVEAAREALNLIDVLNMAALREAIDNDIDPKSKPGGSQTGTTRSA